MRLIAILVICLLMAGLVFGDEASPPVVNPFASVTVLDNTSYRFNLTATDLAWVEWAGGTMTLPVLNMVFKDLPNGHSAYWASPRDEKERNGWEEFFSPPWDKKETTTLRSIGFYEGFGIYRTIKVDKDKLVLNYVMQAICPPLYIAYFRVDAIVLSRIAEASSMPFMATLDNGEKKSGDLFKRQDPLRDIRCLKLRAGNRMMRVSLQSKGFSFSQTMEVPGNPKSNLLNISYRPKSRMQTGDKFELTITFKFAPVPDKAVNNDKKHQGDMYENENMEKTVDSVFRD